MKKSNKYLFSAGVFFLVNFLRRPGFEGHLAGVAEERTLLMSAGVRNQIVVAGKGAPASLTNESRTFG